MTDFTEINALVQKLIDLAVADQKKADGVELQNQINAVSAGFQRQLDNANQTITALRTQIANMKSVTLFGANYEPAGSDAQDALYAGRADVARIYLQNVGNVNFANQSTVKRALAQGIKDFVVSWKDTNVGNVRTFLATIPKGLNVFTSFMAEPENKNGKPGDSAYIEWAAAWKAHWAAQSPIMRAFGCIPTPIIQAWTLYPKSGRALSDWTLPGDLYDVFGVDAYFWKFDPNETVQRCAAAAASLGKPLGVGETGADKTDTERLAKLKKFRQECIDQDVLWACYWNAGGGEFDSHMTQAEADAWFTA